MKHGTTGEHTPNSKADEFDIPSLSKAQLDSLRPLNELRPEAQAALGKGKTRITIMLDNDILAVFRDRAEKQGCGYQTLINEALRAYLSDEHVPLTADLLRRILREELHPS
ncbi:MAG: BrnA antitoxin family protein [Candidatus Competibacteraceae bacterium]